LAQAIRRVVLDPELRARLAQAVRQAARLYAWDRIATQTIEVYQRVLRPRRP
jgi:glycosyltransferase involved in cell wall biosynthesis